MISMRHPFKLFFEVFLKKKSFLKSIKWGPTPLSMEQGQGKSSIKGPIGRKINKVPYHRIYTVVEGFGNRIKNNVPMNRKKVLEGKFF